MNLNDRIKLTRDLAGIGLGKWLPPDLRLAGSCRCPNPDEHGDVFLRLTVDYDLGSRRIIIWADRDGMQMGGHQAQLGMAFPFERGPALAAEQMEAIEVLAVAWEAAQSA